jgi:hypothetical protein
MLARHEQSDRHTIQVLQGLLDVERRARREAEERADVLAESSKQERVQAAVRRFVSSLRQPRRRATVGASLGASFTAFDNAPTFSDKFEDGGALFQTPTLAFTSSPINDPALNAFDTLSLTHASTFLNPFFNSQPTPAADYTPSLTSSTTLPSIDDHLLPPPNLTRSLTALVADMAKPDGSAAGAGDGDGGFVWGGYHPWDCQRCGQRLERVDGVFCKGCGGS